MRILVYGCLVAHDMFICHASEDKDEVARPLAEFLQGRGLEVWFDEFELHIGDSLLRKIDEGIASSRFGVVVLSPHFFEKDWPRRELDGLVARQAASGGVLVLPVWHNVSHKDVLARSPTLAGIYAARTRDGLDRVADQLVDRLRATGQRTTSVATIAGGPRPQAVPRDGSHQGAKNADQVVAIASTPSGYGYWLLTARGRVLHAGDAGYFGSVEMIILDSQLVDFAPSPTGYGYWLVAADGGVFAFGDTGFFGSAASTTLERPIVAMAATRTGQGYWLADTDRRLFAFGDARLYPIEPMASQTPGSSGAADSGSPAG